MSCQLYKPKKRKKKTKLSAIDRLEISGIVIASAALIGWTAWSVADTVIPEHQAPVYEVYLDGIADYLDNIDEPAEESEISPTPFPSVTPSKGPTASPRPSLTPTPSLTPKPSPTPTPTPKPTATPTPKPTVTPTATPKPTVTPTPTAVPTPRPTATPTPKPTPTSIPEYFSKASLNIRKGPGTDKEIIGYYMPGDKINVTEDKNDDWYGVNKRGKDGYVSKKYVEVK